LCGCGGCGAAWEEGSVAAGRGCSCSHPRPQISHIALGPPPPLPLAPSHAALNAFTMYIFTYTSVINAGNFKAEWAKR
jgi:hypothetical protein